MFPFQFVTCYRNKRRWSKCNYKPTLRNHSIPISLILESVMFPKLCKRNEGLTEISEGEDSGSICWYFGSYLCPPSVTHSEIIVNPCKQRTGSTRGSPGPVISRLLVVGTSFYSPSERYSPKFICKLMHGPLGPFLFPAPPRKCTSPASRLRSDVD